MSVTYPLAIFYDGACGLCSTEITYYRSLTDKRVQFVDIAAPDFDAESFGKTVADFQKKLHARDAEGQYFTGVEAFRQLWDTLPSPFYPLLSTFVGLPGIHLAARAGYAITAKFRRFLPSRRAASCPITKKR